MDISIVIQSRGDLHNLSHILKCYRAQTYKHRELVLVIDQEFSQESYTHWVDELTKNDQSMLVHEHIHIYSNLNADFSHQNVSAMRNFGIQKARGHYINLMDDDEDFPENYLEQSLIYWKKYSNQTGKDVIITPTLMYRHTGMIQNQGFSHFNYWLSRPIPLILGNNEECRIQMYSGNSLFAPAAILKKHPMDEDFDFVYEDLDYSHTLYKAGFPIIVLRDLKIYHMERAKTKLENAWVGNIYQAYRKSKHRILFVKKHATYIQKIQFYLLGFWGQPLWLMFKVLIYGQQKNKFSLIAAIWKGTCDGLRK